MNEYYLVDCRLIVNVYVTSIYYTVHIALLIYILLFF